MENPTSTPTAFVRAINVPSGPAPTFDVKPAESFVSEDNVQKPVTDYLALTRNHFAADYFEVADIYRAVGWENEMAEIDKFLSERIHTQDLPDVESSGRNLLDQLAEKLGVVNRPKDERIQAIHTYIQVLQRVEPLERLKKALERVE